jgi:hypothetical protein
VDSAASRFATDKNAADLEVETIGLEDAITATGFPRIDLLKIDIEGAEHEVFAGMSPATLSSAAFCVVECHPEPGTSSDAIVNFLRDAGFEVVALAKPQGLELLVARRPQPATSA